MSTRILERLLDGFEPPQPGQWRQEAEKLLKGAPFEKKMLTHLPEGITLQPIYEDAPDTLSREWPGQGLRGRGISAAGYLAGGWRVSQELPYGLPEEFNEVARYDTARGQTEVHLLLDVAGRAGRDPDEARPGEVGACGTSIAQAADLGTALAGLDWSRLSLCVATGSSGLAFGMLMEAWARQQGVNRRELRGALLFDPVSEYVRTGSLPVSLERVLDEMAVLAGELAERLPGVKPVAVDASVVHEAGGHGVQELAYAMGLAVTYLREMEARGREVARMAGSFRFVFSIGPNFFAELAKLRAARILWSRIVEVSGLKPETVPMEIHARTALRDKSRLDAHTNMLRTTTEAMSAVLGGCSSLHVGPYDEVFQVPDTFSRRIARNTQIILAEECGLGQVIDPAGGSWFVESLTVEMAERAWVRFREIERAGGLVAVLRSGHFQAEVAATASERAKALGTRRESMIGVNTFPNMKDSFGPDRIPDYAMIQEKRAKAVARQRTSGEEGSDEAVLAALVNVAEGETAEKFSAGVEAALQGATMGELTKALRAGVRAAEPIKQMPMRRTAVMYETLRKAAAEATLRGEGPSLLQINLGPSRMYRARADWTTNFFQVAGFAVDASRDFMEIESAVAAARESGQRVVVLCGTDETYGAWMGELVPRLKQGKPAPWVIVAGAPGEQEAAWRAAGVDDFVHVRVPHFTFVSRLLTQLGVLSHDTAS
ncbi:MAG: methylmalonyl-CoA mutase family protein [Candidatus Methylacidiphilales bacterium]